MRVKFFPRYSEHSSTDSVPCPRALCPVDPRLIHADHLYRRSPGVQDHGIWCSVGRCLAGELNLHGAVLSKVRFRKSRRHEVLRELRRAAARTDAHNAASTIRHHSSFAGSVAPLFKVGYRPRRLCLMSRSPGNIRFGWLLNEHCQMLPKASGRTSRPCSPISRDRWSSWRNSIRKTPARW